MLFIIYQVTNARRCKKMQVKRKKTPRLTSNSYEHLTQNMLNIIKFRQYLFLPLVKQRHMLNDLQWLQIPHELTMFTATRKHEKRLKIHLNS